MTPDSPKQSNIPEYVTPEALVWREVNLSDEVLGIHLLDSPPLDQPQSAWDTVGLGDRGPELGRAFLRARRIFNVITYGRNYWHTEFGLLYQMDEAAFVGKHPVIKEATQRLLDLVILSRAPVVKFDDQWNLPEPDNLRHTMTEVRDELGATEAYERLAVAKGRHLFIPDFPGISDTHVVDGILAGRVRMGNSEQPEPVLWQP